MFVFEKTEAQKKSERELLKKRKALRDGDMTVDNIDDHINLFFKSSPNAHFIKNVKASIIYAGQRKKAAISKKVAEAIIQYDSELKSLKDEIRNWKKEQKWFFRTLMKSDLHKQKLECLRLLLSNENSPNTSSARRIYEICMLSYPKAIGWGNTDKEEAIIKRLEEIDFTDEDNHAELEQLLTEFLHIEEIKSSKQIITMSVIHQLNAMNKHFRQTNEKISDLVTAAIFKGWKIT